MSDARPLELTFFPLPYVWDGRKYPGSIHPLLEICNKCVKVPCQTAKGPGIQTCSFGVNFVNLSEHLLAFGFVLKQSERDSPARKKRLKEVGPNALSSSVVERLMEVHDGLVADARTQASSARRLVEAESVRRSDVQKYLASAVKEATQSVLGQFHDYRQFVSQVVNNLTALWYRRDPTATTIEEQLGVAEHEEHAIYAAALLMQSKLAGLELFLEPERMQRVELHKQIAFHQLVTKHVRIYQRSADARNITLEVVGNSYGLVKGHPDALSVIPHTLIDNAIKYAPADSTVRIQFRETGEEIVFSVVSFGPVIWDDEKNRIFLRFVRGAEAEKMGATGMGLGLALLMEVATALGYDVSVDQNVADKRGDLVKTTFSVVLERCQ